MPSLFTGVKLTRLRALQRKPLRHVADKQLKNNRNAVTVIHRRLRRITAGIPSKPIRVKWERLCPSQ